MRDMIATPDAGRLGTQLEVARRLRTDPQFKASWIPRLVEIDRATRARLGRQRDAGMLRSDVDIDQLAAFLELVREGLIAHLAGGLPTGKLDDVLDVVEGAVRSR